MKEEKKSDLVFTKLVDGRIRVDAFKCEMSFLGIAFIKNIESENPLIEIPRPLGISAVKEILSRLENGDTDSI